MSKTALGPSEIIQDADFLKQELHSAKIVATPTHTSWSQAYNAGTLFAVLSLSQTEQLEEKLSIIGKDILNTLEEEFFTLEVKDYESIKKAIQTTIEKAPTTIDINLALIFIKEQILYVFLEGKGSIFLKRNETLGTLLEKQEKLEGASGYIQKGDIIIIATDQFIEIISPAALDKAIDHNSPSEIAETLSPKIHEKEEGGASAIIISYEKETTAVSQIKELKQPAENELPNITSQQLTSFPVPPFPVPNLNLPHFSFSFLNGLTHSRKMFLSVSLLLVLLLLTSVFFSIKTRNDAKTKEKFDAVYKEAQKKYDEGAALLTLNKNLAREDLQNALSITSNGLRAFKEGSNEYKKLTDLKTQIEQNLQSVSGEESLEAKEVSKETSLYITTVLDNPNILYFTKNDTTIYFVDEKGISSIDVKSKSKKLIIEKEEMWKKPGGLGIFGSNLYLLDTQDSQIYKFPGISTPSSNYFTEKPDVSKAVGMTIDSAVYILFSDGSVAKFLRGKQEQFTLTGINGKLIRPTRIFTDAETNNIYILDNGNGRIIVLTKTGTYITQYKSNILKTAREFEVLEKDKKILVAANGKLWQIDLK